jgi:3-isopropylmalate/(R)-2-methylmalate dehydratase large subunit
MMARTLQRKLWDLHTVVPSAADDDTLLYVDRNFVHEESAWSFEGLKLRDKGVAMPASHAAFIDHYAPTVRTGNARPRDPEAAGMLDTLAQNARENGLMFFGLESPRQGIMHVVAPELGLVLPGLLITGSDSHICTNGAFGSLAFGISQTEITQVFATQTVWRAAPKAMRVTLEGSPGFGVAAKDVALAVATRVGANGAAGHIVEYGGSCIARMTMEERMTLCNMSIEMGAQSGLIAPDDTTFSYLESRPHAPKGTLFAEAVDHWRTLLSDPEASFDRELSIDAAAIAPMVSWGTTLEDVTAIDGLVPNPARAENPERRSRMEKALKYMDLRPGMELKGLPVDIVFIGSCTNSRIEDLRTAAAIAKGRTAAVQAVISPGSGSVKQQAEAEGLDRIFQDAGFEWRASGCSMCVGSNGDTVARGKRCASTSPRNFEGRQGVGARTHVMSPAMAAAAAITGKISDVREFIR